jgi:hypothetical protein
VADPHWLIPRMISGFKKGKFQQEEDLWGHGYQVHQPS